MVKLVLWNTCRDIQRAQKEIFAFFWAEMRPLLCNAPMHVRKARSSSGPLSRHVLFQKSTVCTHHDGLSTCRLAIRTCPLAGWLSGHIHLQKSTIWTCPLAEVYFLDMSYCRGLPSGHCVHCEH